jgi:hypothetical protein
MTDVNRLRSLTAGINAALNSFNTAPSTFTTLQPRTSVPSMAPRAREAIERPVVVVDGRRLPRLHGPRNIAAIELPLEMKGANSNTGGAVSDWEAKLEQGNLLASLFGAVGVATTGSAPTVSGGSGTSLTASSTVLANNDIILIPTSAGNELRQVVSGGGSTSIVLNVAMVGTPTNGATIIRLGRYTVAPSLTNHKHMWFNAEGETWRRRYKDCAPMQFSLNIPATGMVEFDSAWTPTDWDDAAEANPSFAAPTAGSPIVSGNNALFIAARSLMFKTAKLTVVNGTQMRESSTGPNGVLGGVCADKTNIMLEAECYVGDDNPSIGEFVDDSGTPSMDDILGSDATLGGSITTRDVMLQVGTVAGQCLFLRLPEADIRGETTENGALTMLKLTMMATGAAPLHLGVG